MEVNRMDIADKIKYLRTEVVKLPQDQFAVKIGVTRSTIKNWESGLSTPTVSHIMMISILCGVSIHYLVFDDCSEELSLNDIDDDQYKVIQTLVMYFRKRNKAI